MEELILSGCTSLLVDCFKNTVWNDTLVFKIKYNFTGIHFFEEPVPEMVKNLIHCTERGEM